MFQFFRSSQVTQRITKLAEFVAILQAHHVSVQQPNKIVENPVFDHLATSIFSKDDQRFSVKENTHFSESVKQQICNSHDDTVD